MKFEALLTDCAYQPWTLVINFWAKFAHASLMDFVTYEVLFPAKPFSAKKVFSLNMLLSFVHSWMRATFTFFLLLECFFLLCLAGLREFCVRLYTSLDCFLYCRCVYVFLPDSCVVLSMMPGSTLIGSPTKFNCDQYVLFFFLLSCFQQRFCSLLFSLSLLAAICSICFISCGLMP